MHLKKMICIAFFLLGINGGLILFASLSIAGDTPTIRINPVIGFFQKHISAVDGNRCPMTPSCSTYAAHAIEKHGLVMGWIMAGDRIVRCGRDEAQISPHIQIKGRAYISDPVEANDFWWFEKKKE